ncbi:MAG: MerR family transcriptional regulator [Alphaproteobacteria bacterium]|nr:MerR family transcriptional regulator [Alphaproteobacteria bacterium]
MVVNKSKDAFRTIAEVADELGVATHVLRFWETKFPQIQPMKRSGGRRYYRPDDVELVRKIKFYLYDKRYTIEGVQKVIKEKGLKTILGEEIQKDFFAESLEQIDLSERNRQLLKDINIELKALSESIANTLDEIKKKA